MSVPFELLVCDHTVHGPEYAVRRGGRSAHYVVMCFQTPFQIYTVAGMERGDPGDCFINAPDFPEIHGGSDAASGFSNDWLHCTGDIAAMADRYGLPLNRRVPTGQYSAVSHLFEKIRAEAQSRKPYCQEGARLMFELLLLNISRLSRQYESSRRIPGEYVELLERLRSHMQAEYAGEWRAEEMARQVNLSPSRFSAIYHELYGISPMEDLLAIRVEKAKSMLVSTGFSVEEIARRCGFKSSQYFSRYFKKRADMSPTRYRCTI